MDNLIIGIFKMHQSNQKTRANLGIKICFYYYRKFDYHVRKLCGKPYGKFLLKPK